MTKSFKNERTKRNGSQFSHARGRGRS